MIFIYLLSTCNVNLHCIHTKNSKYYIHLQKKIKKNTNFANVYNIYQFLCVYNINLHCKCNLYFYIYTYIYYIKRVNEKSYNNFATIVLICLTFIVLLAFFFFLCVWMHKVVVYLLYYFWFFHIKFHNTFITNQIW